MSIWPEGLLFISIALNIFLIYKILAGKRGIAYIASVIGDIPNSGFNRRIHIGFRYGSLEKLGTKLNTLLDGFQSAMEEKQRLELLHRQLTANISHDIRTPLTSMLGFVEVLQREEISPEQQQDYLNIIQSKGQSLYKMIQEFFELSKLESEDTVIKMGKLDLAETVRGTLASFYQEFEARNIVPEIRLSDEPVYVRGDGVSVERVLGNLISNALKYGGEGGIIGISLREDRERAWVDVWDKGRGIPEKDMPFLFNRLYTAETSRNEKMRGNGLGLAIARQLAEKQNGEISVSSIPGEKTTFSFCLMKY